MSYSDAGIVMLVILIVVAFVFWGIPFITRERPQPTAAASRPSRGNFLAAATPLPLDTKPEPPLGGTDQAKEHYGGWNHHLHSDPSLEWYGWHDRFRKEGHGGWNHHIDASPSLEWYSYGQPSGDPLADDFGGGVGDTALSIEPFAARAEGFDARSENFAARKEKYGEPPGMIRAVHQDELGFRGWADMPGDFEGSSASAVSAYIQRSA